jgi:ComF family protein
MKDSVIGRAFGDIIDFVFPALCIYCNENAISSYEDLFCIHCETELPLTDFHKLRQNELTGKFTGRIPIHYGYSMFRFSVGQPIQQIIHRIKYHNEPRLIYLLGKKYGKILRSEALNTEFDHIIPVPLHSRKERKRGFNQSSLFARGISESIGIPVESRNLIRTKHLVSQTKKSRADRILDLQNSFRVVQPSRLRGKHILLVDDVVTTGATLEVCAMDLFKIEGISCSIATLAMAI